MLFPAVKTPNFKAHVTVSSHNKGYLREVEGGKTGDTVQKARRSLNFYPVFNRVGRVAEITQDGERVHGGVSVHRTPWRGVFKHVNTVVVGGRGRGRSIPN